MDELVIDCGTAINFLNESTTADTWHQNTLIALGLHTIQNYGRLKKAQIDDLSYTAWCSRNLLELKVFVVYVLTSEENALRFSQDRIVDAEQVLHAIRGLTKDEPDWQIREPDWKLSMGYLAGLRQAANFTEKEHLSTGKLAKVLGLFDEFVGVNKLLSKAVHPTAFSIFSGYAGDMQAKSYEAFVKIGLRLAFDILTTLTPVIKNYKPVAS